MFGLLSRSRVAGTVTKVPANIPPSLLEGLNPEQVKAVTTLEGPLLIVAGPGAGKTRVLTHRIAALIASGVPPYRILAVTFTNKAAKEMRDRLSILVGEEATRSMWVATFHSACVRMLRLHHEVAGLPSGFTIVDADDSKRLIRQAAKEAGLLDGLTPTEEKEACKLFASAISKAKNDGMSLAQVEASIYMGADVGKAWRAYAARLHAIGAIDFDDILLYAAALMQRRPEVAQWAAKRFTHVLVDEYQDTNRIQEIIARSWAAAGNICVVGDPDQSIYAFRGAAPAVMSSFTQTWRDATVVVLSKNYRSTGHICSVSRAIISENPAQHRAHTSAVASDGDQVLVHSARDSDAEAEWVVNRVVELGPPWTDHAVLLRTAALSRPLEAALRRRGLPYVVTGGQSFYDRAEVKDALAWLRIALNPADALAFARATASPRRGIGESTVERVIARAAEGGTTVLAAAALIAEEGGRSAKALTAFLEELAAVRSSADEGVQSALRQVLGPVGLRAHVTALAAKDGLDRVENLDALMEEARTFDTSTKIVNPEGQVVASLNGLERVVAFVENAALSSDSLADQDKADAEQTDLASVQLMTIHAAKGKEFEHVFVVGLEENVLPHSRALATGVEADVEEERRLMFVATSRAKQTLALTSCRSRYWFGDEQENPPSRFLKDLPEEAVTRSTDHVLWSTSPRLSSTKSGHAGGTSFKGARSSQPGSNRPWRPGATQSTLTPSVNGKVDFKVGDRVNHASFGDGTVTEVSGNYVSVSFGSTPRMFDGSRAPLVKID